MKNIISNILGVLIIGASVFGLVKMEMDLLSAGFLMLVGGGLFYFENKTIKIILHRAINKYI